MIEAVGWQDFPTYFTKCSGLLKPDGAMLLQAITIDDDAYDLEKASRSFISYFIFPGGCLPCPREFRREAAAAGLKVVDEFAFGADYAETLRRWREQFLVHAPAGGLLCRRGNAPSRAGPAGWGAPPSAHAPPVAPPT